MHSAKVSAQHQERVPIAARAASFLSSNALSNWIFSLTSTCRLKADPPLLLPARRQIAAAQHYGHQIAKPIVNAAINAQ
ncbi:MAG: hypothetical protein ACI82I_003559 [Gammaproteobacteria bacterium]|jgi:hypothetical protein